MKYFVSLLMILGSFLSGAAAEQKGIAIPRKRYIDLMEKILSAYSEEHIIRYYNEVRENGLKEHGYPRLTANIGILIAHGKRTDLLPQFIKMMDLCCEQIPKRKLAGNEFSVKEVIFALLELEKKRIVPQEQIDRWKESMKLVSPEKCYRIYAEAPDSDVNNGAAFSMTSELMRYRIGAAPADSTFTDNQAASQLMKLDENCMYRDPKEPMVYDFVTRGLMTLALHFGYQGKYARQWSDALRTAGLNTLKMLSVSGELPYGGRSNQFIHNEAHAAIILEYEAARYAAKGDMKTAARFRGYVGRALENIDLWLGRKTISHVKNAFPVSTGYGCEYYAYFDKYMITAASFLYAAYLLADDSVPAVEPDDMTGVSWQTSDHFHKLFLRAGGYFAEYDYQADRKYDSSGLGRLHRRGAPGAICIGMPGTEKPSYKVDIKDTSAFALVPEIFSRNQWYPGTAPESVHKVLAHRAKGNTASAEILCSVPGKGEVKTSYFLDENGLKITVEGKDTVGFMLPAFEFDGNERSEIVKTGKELTVKFQNWICRCRVSGGVIRDTGKRCGNRNGHYRIFRAQGKKRFTVDISIVPALPR